jgi:hypothetical protein
MRRFAPEELLAFLAAVDTELDHQVSMTVIGGAALAIAYGYRRATHDIDLWGTPRRPLLRASAAAAHALGWSIPMTPAPVADPPTDFEDRLVPVELDLVHLEVWVPEKHDLVLMKLARGYEHDVDAAVALHATVGLDLEVLVRRYRAEMDAAVGDRRRLDQAFLLGIDAVFGEPVADRVEAELRRR